MKRHISFFVVAIALLCGCESEHFAKGRGDVGQFILQQASARGGSPITTNNLPPIIGKWRYSMDKNGVVIRMPREQYPAVELLLHQAFGKPGFGPANDMDGSGKITGWRFAAKGGGIRLAFDTNCTQVIVIHPLIHE